jgi:hypothetical protein
LVAADALPNGEPGPVPRERELVRRLLVVLVDGNVTPSQAA